MTDTIHVKEYVGLMKKRLGKRVRKERLSREPTLTQEELAAIMKLPQPCISDMENGKTWPEWWSFFQLCMVLKWEPNEVLNEILHDTWRIVF